MPYDAPSTVKICAAATPMNLNYFLKIIIFAIHFIIFLVLFKTNPKKGAYAAFSADWRSYEEDIAKSEIMYNNLSAARSWI